MCQEENLAGGKKLLGHWNWWRERREPIVGIVEGSLELAPQICQQIYGHKIGKVLWDWILTRLLPLSEYLRISKARRGARLRRKEAVFNYHVRITRLDLVGKIREGAMVLGPGGYSQELRSCHRMALMFWGLRQNYRITWSNSSRLNYNSIIV